MPSFVLERAGDSAICRAGGVYVLLDPRINKFLVITAAGDHFVTVMGNYFNEASYEHAPVDVLQDHGTHLGSDPVVG